MSRGEGVIQLEAAVEISPQRRLIEAVQAAYESMPEADQKECVGVFLDMITAGVKAAREGRE